MKTPSLSARRPRAGFTLVELLVVIAIIGILASMLLTVLPAVVNSGKKTKAKLEAQAIATAVEQYDSAYGRFPLSTNLEYTLYTLAWSNDFSFGGTIFSNLPSFATKAHYWTNNSEVVAILMNITNYPNGSGPTANYNYVKNPQQTIFLTAKMSGWDPSQGGTPQPGVGNDLIYRDPWGNPYIITMNVKYDGECRDPFYCLQKVSQNPPTTVTAYSQTGYNGLVNPNASPGSQVQFDDFLYHGKVMVWSAGPPVSGHLSVDPTQPANSSANKGHVLSWQ